MHPAVHVLQEEKKKYEPPAPPPRVGKKQRRREGASSLGTKLPTITPTAKCKLRLLKLERVKDWLLMEEEFVQASQPPERLSCKCLGVAFHQSVSVRSTRPVHRVVAPLDVLLALLLNGPSHSTLVPLSCFAAEPGAAQARRRAQRGGAHKGRGGGGGGG